MFKPWSFILGLCVLALFTADALAQPADDHCGDKASQADMTACSFEALEAVNHQLDEAYSGLLQRYRGVPDARENLQRAQKAWLEFRKNECAFEGFETHKGTINSFVVNECYEAYARDRLKMLNARLSCINLSCAIPPSLSAAELSAIARYGALPKK